LDELKLQRSAIAPYLRPVGKSNGTKEALCYPVFFKVVIAPLENLVNRSGGNTRA